MSGEIPQSSALLEATTDSIAELFARDPEGLSRQDRDRIIEGLRIHRTRVAAVEGSKPTRPKAGEPKLPLSSIAPGSSDDMGL